MSMICDRGVTEALTKVGDRVVLGSCVHGVEHLSAFFDLLRTAREV